MIQKFVHAKNKNFQLVLTCATTRFLPDLVLNICLSLNTVLLKTDDFDIVLEIMVV